MNEDFFINTYKYVYTYVFYCKTPPYLPIQRIMLKTWVTYNVRSVPVHVLEVINGKFETLANQTIGRLLAKLCVILVWLPNKTDLFV